MKRNGQNGNHAKDSDPTLKVEEKALKKTEVALVSELMKNSRRSDRELAKAIGVSQPTVSRMIRKLEKERVVNEYTMIPDFRKLGYTICALIFTKVKAPIPPEKIENKREAIKKRLSHSPFAILLLERGIGLDYDAVIVCLYRDYASYVEHMRIIKELPYFVSSEVNSCLIDLYDAIHYWYLTFAGVAKDLLRATNENE